MVSSFILNYLLLLPLISFLIILFIPANEIKILKIISLNLTFAIFAYSLKSLVVFNKNITGFQFIFCLKWLTSWNTLLVFGLDGLSIFFVLLTTFLIPICLLASWKNTLNFKWYVLLFISLEGLLIILFSCLDILVFFIFFEALLIPMFILIGWWSSSKKSLTAIYYLVLYTLFGSIFMLLGLFLVFQIAQTSNLFVLSTINFTFKQQILIWFLFFCSFAVKIPILPFHIWLPIVHVESPTTGSVLLAGILLKLGFYGLIRFSFVLFPLGTQFFTPLVLTLSLISIFYSGLTTLRQIDLKRIIAYSSIVHMNFALLGLFSLNIEGITGSVFVMLSHGLVSGGLFLSIGILYDRYHTRLLSYYSGLAMTMPLFSGLFFILIIANFGLPGTSSFIGEFLILLGILPKNPLVCILAAISLFISTVFSLWLFVRLIFGNLNLNYITNFYDLTLREFIILFVFIFLILVLGFSPSIILNFITTSLLIYV